MLSPFEPYLARCQIASPIPVPITLRRTVQPTNWAMEIG